MRSTRAPFYSLEIVADRESTCGQFTHPSTTDTTVKDERRGWTRTDQSDSDVVG